MVNAYEVKAGIGVISGNTVSSMRLQCEVLYKMRYINTLTFYLYSNLLIGIRFDVPMFVALSYASVGLSCKRRVCLSVCPSHTGNASKPITPGSCGFTDS